MSRIFRNFTLLPVTLGLFLAASGCAKNVDRVNFTKWGNSFVPRGSGVDTTAQGGAAQNGVIPKSQNNQLTKASIAGTYHRTFAASPNYRLIGGFHINANQ